MNAPHYTAELGTLAYFDSFAGLVPCRITSVCQERGEIRFDVQFTATRGPWRRGDTSKNWAANKVIPRDRIIRHRSMSGARILPYVWKQS